MKEKKQLLPLGRKDALRTTLGGRIGEMAKRGMDRLHAPEFHEQFLIADLDFNQERWFTNYSGDISGRFLECMALAGGGDASCHPALAFMLEHIPENQREEGYFGIQVDFGGTIDYEQEVPRMMPILWGNARMLVALVEAWLAFGDERLLHSAERLGDFYVDSAGQLAAPERVEEYHATGTYAPGYATCYFPAIEGLVRLFEVTGKDNYLRQAGKMADFRKEYGFDRLPIEHSHGYLCSLYGLLLLYCATKDSKDIHSKGGEDVSGGALEGNALETAGERWLRMAQENWHALTEGGYVLPTGGLLEKAVSGYNLDEGCSQADWLRVNLLFFSLTGEEKYMDMAERVLHNQLRMNQCSTGGFGHRKVLYDAYGVSGYGSYLWEALWCCDFHVVTALLGLKRYVLLREKESDDIRIPLFLDFQAENECALVTMAEIEGACPERKRWKLCICPKKEHVGVWLRFPDWAGEVRLFDGTGKEVVAKREGRWMELPVVMGTVEEKGREAVEYICEVSCPIRMESRYLGKSLADAVEGTFILRQGPDLLAQRKPSSNSQKVSAKIPAVIERPADDMEAVFVFRAEGV